MKRLAQIIILAIMLQSFIPAHSLLTAQTRKPAATTAAKIGKPVKSAAIPAV